jgi:hypothetical protein
MLLAIFYCDGIFGCYRSLAWDGAAGEELRRRRPVALVISSSHPAGTAGVGCYGRGAAGIARPSPRNRQVVSLQFGNETSSVGSAGNAIPVGDGTEYISLASLYMRGKSRFASQNCIALLDLA